MSPEETREQLKDAEQMKRDCLMCGRECAIVRNQGALTLKAPCPNACGDGYAKLRKERSR